MAIATTVIVTDSASDIPHHLREGLPLVVVPVTLVLDGQIYRDDVDMRAAEFYSRLAADPNLRYSTSCPSPGEILTAYRETATVADGIVSVHLGSGLSGTCAAAHQAMELLWGSPGGGGHSPSPAVEVVDTGTVGMACGFCVLAAARAARAGASAAEAAAEARRVASRVSMYAVVKTLRGVACSGRVPSVVGYFVAKIPICPVLRIGDNRVRLIRPERTYSRSIARMAAVASHEVGDTPVDLAVMHAAAVEEAAALAERMRTVCDCRHVVISEFTPVMGAHTGLGLLGLAFCPAELGVL